jgi:hypothetical protein
LEQRLIQENLAKYLPERKILGANAYSEKTGQIFTSTQNIWSKELFRKIWLNIIQNEKNIWSKDLFRKIKFKILCPVLLFLKCYAFREN